MLPTGHISVSYLLHRYARVDLRIAVIATLFPDVLDKSLKLILHVMPAGRTFGHGLPLVLAATVLVALWKGRYGAYSWFMGHFCHLLADWPLTGYVPWLYPLVEYDFPSGGPPVLVTWPELVLDLGTLSMALYVFWKAKRAESSPDGI